MYWVSAFSPYSFYKYQIERAYLDGSQRSTLISDIGLVTDLTIDYGSGRLFWADSQKGTIESAGMDGGSILYRLIYPQYVFEEK